jgi:spoIIIJ-associated protein
MEESIQYAKKYLEDLLSFFGLNTDVYATTEDHQVIELQVPSTHLNGFLIGQRGDTMRALQYVISMALKHAGYEYTRVNVDVADYKKNRNDRLVQKAEVWFVSVRDNSKDMELQPMSAAERRVIHKAATDFGLETESVGEGRERHIILKPGSALPQIDEPLEEPDVEPPAVASEPSSEEESAPEPETKAAKKPAKPKPSKKKETKEKET